MVLLIKSTPVSLFISIDIERYFCCAFAVRTNNSTMHKRRMSLSKAID
jgi:hypothetical protein